MRPSAAAFACLLAAPPARAEFVLRSTPPPIERPTVPAEVPRVPKPWPTLPRTQGFGEDVPLGFAVGMIVPGNVRIEWWPETNPRVPVSWTGGRPWNVVLAEAIRPHGYKAVATAARVEIKREGGRW